MRWRLDFWKPEDSKKSPVMKELEKEIKGNSEAKKIFLALVETLEELGPREFSSSRNKPLGQGLYELRDLTNGKRYYYVETRFRGREKASTSERIILLLGAVGSKNNASEQNRDIMKARERLANLSKKNILNNEAIEVWEKK